MKIFPKLPYRLGSNEPLSPELVNTSFSYVCDTNNDVLSQRYSRWTTTYDFNNVTNTSLDALRIFKLPAASQIPSKSITLGYPSNGIEFFGILSTVYDVQFDPTGTIGMVLGISSVTGGTCILQYSCTRPFYLQNSDTLVTNLDLSANSNFNGVRAFCFQHSVFAGSTGTRLFTISQTAPATIRQHSLSTAWNISTLNLTPTSSLNISADTTTPDWISFSYRDVVVGNGFAGRDMMYGSAGSSTYYVRNLSTGWTLSTAGAATARVSNSSFVGMQKKLNGATSLLAGKVDSLSVGVSSAGTFYTHNLITGGYTTASTVGDQVNIKQAVDHYAGFAPASLQIDHNGRYAFIAKNDFGNPGVITVPLSTPWMGVPQIVVERIKVTAYYTSNVPLTITITGLSGTPELEAEPIVLPISTDNTIKRSAFIGRKISGGAGGTIFLSAGPTPTYNILKLLVEMDFSSDRFWDVFNAGEPSSNANEVYQGIKETNTASSSEFLQFTNSIKNEIAQNLGLSSNTRWQYNQFENITNTASSNLRSQRILLPPRLNPAINQNLVGMYLYATDLTGASTSGVTATVTYQTPAGTELMKLSGTLNVSPSYSYNGYLDMRNLVTPLATVPGLVADVTQNLSPAYNLSTSYYNDLVVTISSANNYRIGVYMVYA